MGRTGQEKPLRRPFIDYIPEDPIYVHWRGGIYKVLDFKRNPRWEFKIRWVRGPRPDQGILHWVSVHKTTELTELEVIGLMGDEDIVP
jgi:hypothetical protein